MSIHDDPWHTARSVAIDRGTTLRRLRTWAGMTQGQLADEIGAGLDTAAVSRIEGGWWIPTGLQASRLGDWIAQETRLQTSLSAPIAYGGPPAHMPFPTPPRATHPDTSRKAMTAVNRANAWAIHQWVLGVLGAAGDLGATHEELWNTHQHDTRNLSWVDDAPPKTSQSGLRTRVSELVRGGVVEDSGRTRTMSTGRQAIVWTLKEEGNNG